LIEDCISISDPVLTSDLDLQPTKATVMTHTQATGQRSFASKVRAETDKWTVRRRDCITSHANAGGNKHNTMLHVAHSYI